MIKKYGIGLLAIIIAVGAVAFTKPGKGLKPFVNYAFHYTSTTYTQTEVQKNSNWSSGGGSGCGSTQNIPCQMNVLSTYTHDDGSGTQVLNDANSGGSILSITAVHGANGVDYVPQASTSIPSVNDKP